MKDLTKTKGWKSRLSAIVLSIIIAMAFMPSLGIANQAKAYDNLGGINTDSTSESMDNSDAVTSDTPLKREINEEYDRHNSIIIKASSLKTEVQLNKNSANSIMRKWGVTYLSSSSYYSNMASQTERSLSEKRTQKIYSEQAGNRLKVAQLEREIEQLNNDYRMYLELKSAAQFMEKAERAQVQLDRINLDEEEALHKKNIAAICEKYGVVNENVDEVKSVKLEKEQYEYTGKATYPIVIVTTVSGKILGPESYSITYISDCRKVGNHSIEVSFKGDYIGTKELSFTIVDNDKNDNIDEEVRIEEKPSNEAKAEAEAKAKAEKKAIAKAKKLTVKGFKVNANKGKKVTATWKVTKGAKGYQIMYSLNKKFKKAKKVNIKKAKAKKAVIKKLKAKKKYFVKIRPYSVVKKANGKKVTVYGKWSKVKKVKAKK